MMLYMIRRMLVWPLFCVRSGLLEYHNDQSHNSHSETVMKLVITEISEGCRRSEALDHSSNALLSRNIRSGLLLNPNDQSCNSI